MELFILFTIVIFILFTIVYLFKCNIGIKVSKKVKATEFKALTQMIHKRAPPACCESESTAFKLRTEVTEFSLLVAGQTAVC